MQIKTGKIKAWKRWKRMYESAGEKAVIRFAERWADGMEEAMQRTGKSVVEVVVPIILKTPMAREPSIAVLASAEKLLVECWQWGDELQRAIESGSAMPGTPEHDDIPLDKRLRLILSMSPEIKKAFDASEEDEIVVVDSAAGGDMLARSMRFTDLRVRTMKEAVVVKTFGRVLGETVLELIESTTRDRGICWVLCLAYGGATFVPFGGPSGRGPWRREGA